MLDEEGGRMADVAQIDLAIRDDASVFSLTRRQSHGGDRGVSHWPKLRRNADSLHELYSPVFYRSTYIDNRTAA